jgi:hypothetical protein
LTLEGVPPRKGGRDITTSLHLGRELSSEHNGRAPAVYGEGKILGLTEYCYSVSSIDWAILVSTFTPGPMVEVIVMCLM